MKYFSLMNKDVIVLNFAVNTMNTLVNYNICSVERKDLIPRNMEDLSSWISECYLMVYRGDLRVVRITTLIL